MSSEKKKSYDLELELTPHNAWAQKFWDDLIPAKEKVSEHPVFKAMGNGTLSLECFKFTLLNFYPLVAHFPSYMAGSLVKATDFALPGVTDARNWLIQNIKVEERHLIWYRDWANGFGLTVEQLDHVRPPVAMNAVNHFLWSTNYRCSLVESIAATNLAIEWATGDWSKQVYKGVESYTSQPDVKIERRTMAWLRAHAHYDDMHPHEAMELIKRLCGDDEVMQKKAFNAAQQGLEYYALALDCCYEVQQKG